MTPRFGLSARHEHMADLWRGSAVEAVEVIAERWLQDLRRARAERALLDACGPLSLHCVSLSLGSPRPPTRRALRDLSRLVDAVEPQHLSDHMCITRVRAGEIGHLTPLSPGPDAARRLTANIRAVQRATGMRLALENIASVIRPPGPWSHWQLLAEVADRADCDLLLDLENLHADEENFGDDGESVLRALPLERVRQVHLAGGHHHGSLYIDDHGSAVAPRSLELLTRLRALGARPDLVIVERDHQLPRLSELLEDVARARTAWCSGVSVGRAA
jgi:uncharacterized protein (UPF0276 family)